MTLLSNLTKWAPLINTGAQLLLSGSAAKSADKQANEANSSYDDAERLRLGLALKGDSRADQLMDRYDNTFVPLQDNVIKLASRKISPEIEAGKAGSDVEQQLAVQQDALKRNYGRMGVNPGDGAAIDAQSRLALAGGLGRAAAMTDARRTAKDTELSRMATAAQMGQNLPATAAGFTSQANAGVADVLNQRGATLSDANRVAQEAGQGVGQSIGDVLGTVFDPESGVGKLLGVGSGAAKVAPALTTGASAAPAALGSAASIGSIGAAAPAALALPSTLAGASLLGGSAAATGAGAGMGIGASGFAGGSTAVGTLGSAGFGGGAAATGGAAAGTGMAGVMQGLMAAAPYVAAAIAVGAVVSNNLKKSSPLNDSYDTGTGTFTKGAHFDNTKFTAQELQSYFGKAMDVFRNTGDAAAALAAIPPPSNAKEQIMLKGGAKALFGGTGNPMRQEAKLRGYTGGIYEAGDDEKKSTITSLANAAKAQAQPAVSPTPIPLIPRKVA